MTDLDLDLAIHSLIHKSDLSAYEIAEQIGVSYQTLINKANFNNETHKLNVRELLSAQLVTSNYCVLDVLIAQRDSTSLVTDKKIADQLLDLTKEYGEAFTTVYDALADRVITDTEKKDCLKEIGDLEHKLNILKNTLRGSK